LRGQQRGEKKRNGKDDTAKRRSTIHAGIV